VNYEIRHSNMLAWLLDSLGSHGFEASILRDVVMRPLRDGINTEDSVTAIECIGMDFVPALIRREALAAGS